MVFYKVQQSIYKKLLVHNRKSSKSELQLCKVTEMNTPELEQVTHSEVPRPKTASFTIQAAERDMRELSSSTQICCQLMQYRMVTLELSCIALEIPDDAYNTQLKSDWLFNTHSELLADWLKLENNMRRQLWALTCPIHLSKLNKTIAYYVSHDLMISYCSLWIIQLF